MWPADAVFQEVMSTHCRTSDLDLAGPKARLVCNLSGGDQDMDDTLASIPGVLEGKSCT